MAFPDYSVVETELGPMVGESRTSIYDVLITLNEGEDFDSICVIHNLNIVQTQLALEYIEAHRQQLEAELPELLAKKAERERYYRALAAERARIPVEMTPLRQAFNTLLEKNRKYPVLNGTDHFE